MARITFSKFSKNYQLLLLPYSTSAYKIGYKAEWKGRVRKRFQIENNYIFNYFPFSVPQKDKLLRKFEYLNRSRPVEAAFASLDLNTSTEIGAGLGTTRLGKLVEANTSQESVFHFSFEGVTARTLADDSYNAFFQQLKAVEDKEGKFKKRENKLMFIEQLFFAESVTMSVAKSIGAGIKAKAGQLDVEAIIERESRMDITFSNHNAAFAVKLKTISDLMD